jgi:hypothetical protein
VLQSALVGYASAHWLEHYRHIRKSNKRSAGYAVRLFISKRDNLDWWASLYCERERPTPDEPGPLGSLTQAICHLGYLNMLKVPALQAEEDLRLALDHAVEAGRPRLWPACSKWVRD